MKIKNKIHNALNENTYFLKFMYGLIILNVLSIILESYVELRNSYGQAFLLFEYCSVFIFSIEYILRIWVADLDYKEGNLFTKKLKYMTSKFGIIDLLAVLPFYLPLLISFDLRILRIFRLFALLRIFKLARLSKSMSTIISVLKETKADLTISILVVLILLIFSSTLMFYIENEAQPEKFENIGQAMWWSVATLTTVGYGDIYPITGLGQFLSAITSLIGIGFVALPTGIISSAFVSKIKSDKKEKKNECPKCGNKF